MTGRGKSKDPFQQRGIVPCLHKQRADSCNNVNYVLLKMFSNIILSGL